MGMKAGCHWPHPAHAAHRGAQQVGVSERKSQSSGPRGAQGMPLLVVSLPLALRFWPMLIPGGVVKMTG